jgi:hypothetical protein
VARLILFTIAKYGSAAFRRRSARNGNRKAAQ